MKTKLNPSDSALLNDIRWATSCLSDAWRAFDQTTDPDQIDACIYSINAAASQYTRLLKKARQCGLRCPYPAVQKNIGTEVSL